MAKLARMSKMAKGAKQGARSARKNAMGDWFRLGIVSATVVAPLVARWNELRASERARLAAAQAKDLGQYATAQGKMLSDQAAKRAQQWGALAEEQTRDLRAQAAERSRQWAELARARSNEWRDLAADRASDWSAVAAERAEDLRKQAQALSSDLRVLAADRSEDLKKLAGVRLEDARQQFLATKTYETLKEKVPALAKLDNRKPARRMGATIWLVGAGLGVITVGVVAYIIARRRMAAPAEDQLVELPQSGANGAANGAAVTTASSPRSSVSPSVSGLRAAAGEAGIATMRDIDTASDADVAPIVGNIHTLVYHLASDADSLPSEENRIYFASESEARAAGYHPAQPSGV